MSKYKFGYDESSDKDFTAVSVYNAETKEITSFYKAEDISRHKDQRIAELEELAENNKKRIENLQDLLDFKKCNAGKDLNQMYGEMFIEQLQENQKLKQELADLKQNAIVPKYKNGQAENINHLKTNKRRKQMSDYINTLTVILEEPIKDEICDEIINAIKMIKYVKNVNLGNIENIDSYIAYQKAKEEYFKAIKEVFIGDIKCIKKN